MRSRPDIAGQVTTPQFSCRRGLAMLAAPLVFLLSGPTPVRAQVGLGAERYEVTITPPKRPGSEDAPAEEGVSPPGFGVAGEDGADTGGAPPTPVDGANAGDATPAAAQPAAKRATVPSAAASASAGPLRTLQIGAYRRRSSAEELRDSLLATFREVTVIEVESGGEPLYRVNVGRLPRGPALEDLKRRLLAAGHPAFEVPAPGSTKKN